MKLLKHLSIGAIAVSSVALIGTTNVEATTAVVNVKSLYLREEASASSDMVDGLIQGQKLEVLEELEGWYKVKADGEIGYVSADYVDIVDRTEAQEQKSEEVQNEEAKLEETKVEETTTEEPKQEEKPMLIQENTVTTETKKVEKKEFQSREVTLEKDAKAYILPLINSNVLKELKSGAKVTLLDEVNGWYYFEDEEINGWVNKRAFGEDVNNVPEATKESEAVEEKEETTEEEKKEENTTTDEKEITKTEMYVNTSSVYVRKGPGTDYDVVDSLILNDKVYVIAEADDWYKVEVDGETGYIAKRLLSDKEQETTSRSAEERNVEDYSDSNNEQEASHVAYSSIGEEIADFAQEYLGCKYVYGGSGPSTFDCSGFTMYVYSQFGVNLSHSATAQSRVGEYVSKDDLEPGDLVFFKDYETMDGIGHVGIYIGDGNFIHASSGTGYCVKISTLLSGSYNTRYETARRIF